MSPIEVTLQVRMSPPSLQLLQDITEAVTGENLPSDSVTDAVIEFFDAAHSTMRGRLQMAMAPGRAGDIEYVFAPFLELAMRDVLTAVRLPLPEAMKVRRIRGALRRLHAPVL